MYIYLGMFPYACSIVILDPKISHHFGQAQVLIGCRRTEIGAVQSTESYPNTYRLTS